MPDFLADILALLINMPAAALVASVAITFCVVLIVSFVCLFRFLEKVIDREREK